MHATLVTYDLGPDRWDEERLDQVKEHAIPMYSGMDGLRSKTFLADRDDHVTGGFYVFESREHADALFTDAWIERVTAAIGAPPEFHHFEATVHIDNVADLVAT